MPLETPASCPLPLSLDFPLLVQTIIFLQNPQLHSWNSIILSGFSQFNTYLGSIYFDIYYFRNISTLIRTLEIYIDPKSHDMGKLTLFLQFCCLRPGVLWSELASNHSQPSWIIWPFHAIWPTKPSWRRYPKLHYLQKLRLEGTKLKYESIWST